MSWAVCWKPLAVSAIISFMAAEGALMLFAHDAGGIGDLRVGGGLEAC